MYASTHYRRPTPSDRWRDVIDRVAAERLSTPAILASPMQNVCAASLCSAVTVAFSLSFAALIFSGPLSPGLGYGIAVTFLSASVGGFVVALRGSLPFALPARTPRRQPSQHRWLPRSRCDFAPRA
jgi:hypothetical protein